MAATDITYQQDAGDPNQLQQGAASELNAALPTETASAPQSDAEAAAAQAAAMVPVQPAVPADYQPQYQPQTEDEQLLFDQTARPNEPLLAGVSPDRSIPPQLAGVLPLLSAWAAEPDAPPQLKALVDQTLYFLNQNG